MTALAALTHLYVGSIIGFVAGIAVGSIFAFAHPTILEAWEKHRMAKESRLEVNKTLKYLNELARKP